jgi:hypothetical protein
MACIILVGCVLFLTITEWFARAAFPIVLVEYGAHKESYRTSEFDVVASINTFGFRGVERQVTRGQIVTIGDSFTFGWGVNDQDTWQAALALKLRSRGTPLSVYNLGRPGADPDAYLDFARTYIPVLKPRLVIIGIHQGHNPGQVLERLDSPPPPGPPTSLYQSLKSHTMDALPGLYGAARALRVLLGGSPSSADIVVTEGWPEYFPHVISMENAKFPEDITQMARSGNLNPYLLELAARYPRHYVAAYEPAAINRVEPRIQEILGQITSMSEAQGASVILLSLPDRVYFDSANNEITARIGFELPAPQSCVMDDLVERLARSLNVGFMTLTNEIRRRSDRDDLWFAYDGHLTAKGNGIIADYIDTRIAGIVSPVSGHSTKVPYFGEACSVMQ